MESFFLAETTKYLYLLFDPENFIHNTGQHGTIIKTPNGECVIDAGGYIFNTEAHPIDPAALHCCSQVPQMTLFDLGSITANKKLFQGDSLHDRRHQTLKKLKEHKNDDKRKGMKNTPDIVYSMSNNNNNENKSNTDTDDVKFVEPIKVEESAETIPTYYGNDEQDENTVLPDKIQTVTGVGSINELTESDNESAKDLFRDIEENYTLLPEFVNQFLTQTQNMRPKFDPQRMLERLRSDKRYERNTTWENNFQMLSCEAQPFLQKISLGGEFFDNY